MTSTPTTGRGTYQVRTFGCQMNVHDSERLAGLLETAGYTPAPESADVERGDVDVIVFNTCAVRENADRRLYGHLGMLRPAKRRNPNLQIAVGGCLAQKDRSTITDRAPWVDVVFGTHNIHSLPVLLDRARHERDAQVEILESLEVFPSTLPTKRESAAAGWVSISVGCNNTCTFCIVPSLRGKEKDRRPGDILAEVQHLVDTGAIEVTLLGQNVNSYGVEFGDRGAFAKLLRACGEIDGLERIRFTSPHPAMFTDDVIDAMAETPTVMPQLHMPLQSGSDRILKAMRRSYRSAKFLRILDSVRERIPHAAITTDIIVGFPGETEDDFQRTLDVVEASRFSSAFTFQYSPRPGTPAADMEDQVPKEVVQDRYERLTALQDRISAEENQRLIGTEVEVIIGDGEGTRDQQTHRLSGRSRDNRLVHVGIPAGLSEADMPRPGDAVTARVTAAAPFYLVADSGVTPADAGHASAPTGASSGEPAGEFRIRRTRSGDAWQARLTAADDSCSTGGCGTGPAPAGPVGLGMPSVRAPQQGREQGVK
ncbi:tRNA (N6-isopentenyl adenosine(37)-C2)-methylthiotransferase MiaB [Helcobacillus massiliensis]|uniref:tRNA-2-methylthio-N(6)-dimethylallyladenosine synthase n=1 Tax=Helcobacillus massiliensis TaxID=521392 RepID=A0A839QUW7_9MICO|nr:MULTISPECIES: tRNA (N6-isopentenyl adenosine(37)-C2)-methylthiotransferase MiaB [Helcobacillus]MBB3021811.1 tRNA-2-methylthio-N6-dimethylallyladenosine synthase [Helcobacillus massiliensis]MCG7427562.1 tRNA (N6-isopentenyl adenosine(37)-C2)-methylthiotransferase MiaB [Helcobacillus sp. ACRRO]MCT1557859.1 tRNA (N6-isopentenyl adenosine(37)-C2)-methylthiotransferase MiaB [Helcobacillus massiliensis]MCT2036645.1 tRNA (N6-isopentenyl adenosine(37)-C2)-methylthiotransferase MiaB [Helcobacillus ma